jgi:hypothetical protein
VDKLERDATRLAPRLRNYRAMVETVVRPEVQQALWERLLGGGFRDAGLPHAWYEVAVTPAINRVVDEAEEEAALGVIGHRLTMAKMRLIGGKCLIGDRLFIGSLQRWVDSRHAKLDAAEPAITGLSQRVEAEFGDMRSRDSMPKAAPEDDLLKDSTLGY